MQVKTLDRIVDEQGKQQYGSRWNECSRNPKDRDESSGCGGRQSLNVPLRFVRSAPNLQSVGMSAKQLSQEGETSRVA